MYKGNSKDLEDGALEQVRMVSVAAVYMMFYDCSAPGTLLGDLGCTSDLCLCLYVALQLI